MNRLITKLQRAAYRELTITTSVFIALALSMFLVFWLYPLHFLLGDSAFFEQGDISQHISGWLMYRGDAWRFPLLETRLLDYPEGSNIAFTDSIPIAALVFKLFRGFLPGDFHYFGLWSAFAFINQGVAAVFIARACSLKSVVATVSLVTFAIVSPALLWRIGHPALMAHALILYSMANYLFFMNDSLSAKRSAFLQIVILLLSLLTHPYFYALNFSFFACILVIAITKKREPILFAAKYFGSLLLLTLTTMYVFGYLGESSQALGYGEFSFNLVSPFCWGNFYFCNIDQTGGQGEGFSYLGMGTFALVGTVFICARQQVLAGFRKHGLMLACLFGLVIYAASNKVYFSERLLVTYAIPEVLQIITSTFRASGRFIWVPYYFLILFVLILVLRLENRRIALPMVVLALVVQIADVSGMLQHIRSLVSPLANPSPERLHRLVEASDIVLLFPPFRCGDANGDAAFTLEYQRLAANHGKPVNTAYIARGHVDCEKKMDFLESHLTENQLLIINGNYLNPTRERHARFLNRFLKNNDCLLHHEDLLCVSGWRQTEWLSHGYSGPFVSLDFASNWSVYASYKASELPTIIGEVDGDFLVSNKNKSGILSYGPYITLPAGVYKVKIKYKSSDSSQVAVARWDIMSSGATGQKIHAEGKLVNTQGEFKEFETLLVVDDSSEGALFEVRLRPNNDVKFTFQSLAILRNQSASAENADTTHAGEL